MPEPHEVVRSDQRAHQRVPLVLPGQLRISGGAPSQCVVVDLSSGGAGLQYVGETPAQNLVAELEIEGFGTFAGLTIREQGQCRGLRFVQGEAERNRLLEKLTRYIEVGITDNAAGPLPPAGSGLSLIHADGAVERCQVLCITLQGVSLRTVERPRVGELVRLGRMYGRVAAQQADGIAVRFLSFVHAPAS